MQRILVIEFLHANSEAYVDAADSMRREGRQMLSAILDDLTRLSDLSVSVPLCARAAIDFECPHGVVHHAVNDSAESEFTTKILRICSEAAIDTVLPIAPECDGILTSLVVFLRQHGIHVVAPKSASVELCSDKWATHQFLQRHELPVIPTQLFSDFERLADCGNPMRVVKPRDGAGCGGIFSLPATDLLSLAKAATDSNPRFAGAGEGLLQAIAEHGPESHRGFLVQPFLKGESFSVAMIGQGTRKKPVMLPVATQMIDWSDERPVYSGGCLPAHIPRKLEQHIQAIAMVIGRFLPLQDGYLGVDFLLPEGSDEILVTELNPRLCTSYVGYRQATTNNLAACLLQREPPADICWTNQQIRFHTAPGDTFTASADSE